VVKHYLEVVLKTESPLLVVQKWDKTNYSTALDYIPGSSIFGALMNQMIMNETSSPYKIYTNGFISYMLKSEKNEQNISKYLNIVDIDYNEPELIVSDFTPCSKSFKRYTPPLMSIMKCRLIKEHYMDSTLYLLKKYANLYPSKFTKSLIITGTNISNLMDLYTPLICNDPNCSKSSIYPSALKKSPRILPIESSEGKESVKIEKQSKVFIGTNPITKTTDKPKKSEEIDKGKLFTQEYIQPNQLFKGFIIFDDKKYSIDKIYKALKSMNIGGRKSSGFGKISIQSENKTKTIDQLKETLKNKYIEIQNQLEKYLKMQQKCSIIPFFAYSHIPIKTLYQIKNELSNINPNSTVDIKFLNYKNTILKIRNQVINKWEYLDVIIRGSTGFIEINSDIDDNTKNKIYDILTNYNLLLKGYYSYKGLGELEFYPEILFKNINKINFNISNY